MSQSTAEDIATLIAISRQECLGEDRYVREIPGGLALMIRRNGPAGEIQQYIPLTSEQLRALDIYRFGVTIEQVMTSERERCAQVGAVSEQEVGRCSCGAVFYSFDALYAHAQEGEC